MAVMAVFFSQTAYATTLDPNNYQAGYQYGMNDWNQHTDNKVGGMNVLFHIQRHSLTFAKDMTLL